MVCMDDDDDPQMDIFTSGGASDEAPSEPAQSDSEADEFRELEQAAIEKGRIVSSATDKLAIAWKELIPILFEIWKLLSQRGDPDLADLRKTDHAYLPTWSQWLRDFAKKYGVCDRTMQRKLQPLQKKFLEEQSKNNASTQQPGDAQAEHAGTTEIVTADSGPDEPEASESSHHVDVSPARCERRESGGTVSADPGDALDSDAPALRPGDWPGLARLIAMRCGREIKAVLSGSSLAERLEMIADIVEDLVQRLCAGMRIEVIIRLRTPDPSQSGE